MEDFDFSYRIYMSPYSTVSHDVHSIDSGGLKIVKKKTNPTVSTVTYLWDRSSKYSQARYFL